MKRNWYHIEKDYPIDSSSLLARRSKNSHSSEDFVMTTMICPHCNEGTVNNVWGDTCNKCGKDPSIMYFPYVQKVACIDVVDKYRKTKDLISLCKKFIKDNKISCEECIHQTDWVIENAYEFIERICDIVGYYEEEHV
jgi:hypothetical protein